MGKINDEVIYNAVVSLLEKKRYDYFTIKDVCDTAEISRTAFYDHYQDINDLMIKIESNLAKKLASLFDPKEINSNNSFIALFNFIKDNKIFYKAFLKSHSPSFTAEGMIEKQKKQYRQELSLKYNYTESELDYHLRFFAAGIKAVCEQWVMTDCKETPKQMARIIYDEYANNAKYFENE